VGTRGSLSVRSQPGVTVTRCSYSQYPLSPPAHVLPILSPSLFHSLHCVVKQSPFTHFPGCRSTCPLLLVTSSGPRSTSRQRRAASSHRRHHPLSGRPSASSIMDLNGERFVTHQVYPLSSLPYSTVLSPHVSLPSSPSRHMHCTTSRAASSSSVCLSSCCHPYPPSSSPDSIPPFYLLPSLKPTAVAFMA
jgi:hypothetical protein